MKKFTLLLLVALSSLSLLLGGCNAPKPVGRQVVTDDGGNVSGLKLSPARIAEIRQALIGRSFVFKEDWYEYAYIDSDPLGGFSDPAPITNLSENIERRGYRKLAASKGTVAKITGLRMYHNAISVICETESGGNAYIYILNHRPWTIMFGSRNTNKNVSRDALKDDRITVAWIEWNLTFHTVEFIESLPEVPAVDLALPSPPQEPTLTPAPVAGSGTLTPTIGQLDILADPPLVRNNQVLNLMFNYTVETAGQVSLPVTETRTLLLDGNLLPGYPQTTSESRSTGRYTTNYQQTIPPRARAGTYTYEGKVCVSGDCISRSKTFQVAP